jgi:Spy/CpxP family protein refolding chaperone
MIQQVAGESVHQEVWRTMMRTLTIGLIFVAVVLLCPSLRADEPNGRQAVVMVTERIQDLNLTDDQEAKLKNIKQEYGSKVQDAAKELGTCVKEEEEQIRGALTDEQKQKLEAFKEERKEHRSECLAHRFAHLKDLDLTEEELAKIHDIRSECRPKIEKAMESLKGILTEQQRTAREEGLKAGKSHKEVLASLNLSEEQKEKVAAACKEVGTAVREEMEKIRDVLTPEQQAQLPELKDERKERVRDRWASRVSNFRELNLTDDQKTKIENIRKEFRPKIHEAGNKLRAAIREEVEAVVAVLKA